MIGSQKISHAQLNGKRSFFGLSCLEELTLHCFRFAFIFEINFRDTFPLPPSRDMMTPDANFWTLMRNVLFSHSKQSSQTLTNVYFSSPSSGHIAGRMQMKFFLEFFSVSSFLFRLVINDTRYEFIGN